MIRVQQQIVDPINGDCLRACVASLLELPIEKVPNFAKFSERFLIVFEDFMRIFGGYESSIVSQIIPGMVFKDSVAEIFSSYGSISGLTIASVRSNRYLDGVHAVIINENFQVVFDPTTDLDYSIEGRNLSNSSDLYGYWIFNR